MSAAAADMNGKANKRPLSPISRSFSKLATSAAGAAGRPPAFVLAALVIVVWAGSGPIFDYSDTWQLVINTGTTIVTFLMVFLIQNSQNRDSAAIQVKLDEIIRSGRSENRFVGIEHLTEEEIDELREKCERRAKAKRSRLTKAPKTPGQTADTGR